MRTSGGGNRDFLMMSVPVGILALFAVVSGGGVKNLLQTIERTLWRAMDWVIALVS